MWYKVLIYVMLRVIDTQIQSVFVDTPVDDVPYIRPPKGALARWARWAEWGDTRWFKHSERGKNCSAVVALALWHCQNAHHVLQGYITLAVLWAESLSTLLCDWNNLDRTPAVPNHTSLISVPHNISWIPLFTHIMGCHSGHIQTYSESNVLWPIKSNDPIVS